MHFKKNGKVVNIALMTLVGISADGENHIFAVNPMEKESKETWGVMKLKQRDLCSVYLLVSDVHLGIK